MSVDKLCLYEIIKTFPAEDSYKDNLKEKQQNSLRKKSLPEMVLFGGLNYCHWVCNFILLFYFISLAGFMT